MPVILKRPMVLRQGPYMRLEGSTNKCEIPCIYHRAEDSDFHTGISELILMRGSNWFTDLPTHIYNKYIFFWLLGKINTVQMHRKHKETVVVGLKPYMLYFSSRFCPAQKADKKNTHIAYKGPTHWHTLTHTLTHTHGQAGPCAHRH